MSTGAILLGVISLVTIGDVLVGLYYLRRAAVQVGAPPAPNTVPPKTARLLGLTILVTAPLMWLFMAAICFGVLPVGIDPIVIGGAG